MIEFRQSYIGPAIRKYGNIFRAGDCPADILSNRIHTIDLRLTSGSTAVHSDMLDVITSYSIHYTKLYETLPEFNHDLWFYCSKA